MNILQLEDSPSQEFGIEDYRIRLNYNYLCNMWSFTLFDANEVAITSGNFIYVGLNLLAAVGSRLIVADSVSCPTSDWYSRLTKIYADDLPQTVLVYDVQ